MTSIVRVPALGVLATLAVVALLVSSCSERSFTLVEAPLDAGGQPPPLLGSSDASVDASTVGLCPTNKCPAGRATCPNAAFPCAVDLQSDNENCGACGNYCPPSPGLFTTSECFEGACRLRCTATEADCNGSPDDGCEVRISSDQKNCGGCGIVCTGSDECINGLCKCATDWQGPDYNCGGCGIVCPKSTEQPVPAAWHASRHCAPAVGVCNVLTCDSPWLDCDGDLGDPDGNGCELNGRSDVNNCGGCGNVCAPGERCSSGLCKCPGCGSICFNAIDSDVNNCGGCRVVCPGDRRSMTNPELDEAHGRPVCAQGVCDYRCSEHWGDCDHSIENGCETNLFVDPLNCGACGVRCDGVDGQACVDGQCTMTECTVQ